MTEEDAKGDQARLEKRNSSEYINKHKERYSRSAHQKTTETKAENRRKSAPIQRNIQSREISRNYDASVRDDANCY